MRSFKEIEELCRSLDITFPEAVISLSCQEEDRSPEAVYGLMRERLLDMGRSVEEALSGTWNGTFARDQAEDLSHYMQKEDPISGAFIVRASQISMSVASYNSCMGRIVAAPTAGSCGILPGILFSWKERYGPDQESLLGAVVTAAGIGEIIAERATLAGAEGGCQAECGAAAAMASGALVYLRKGGAEKISHAVALVLKSLLGLVCDPVAGLVEIPCIKRNGSLVSLFALCADMALAGVRSAIPCDEVIDAMGSVGRSLPEALKETSLGGVAVTPTGRRMAEESERMDEKKGRP